MIAEAPILPPSWITETSIRLGDETDLPELEWEGEFTHMRRVYADAWKRCLAGGGVIWVADHPAVGVIGQAFIQFLSNRPELADGRIRAYLYAFRIRPIYRNCGLGSQFLEIIEDDLVSRNFRLLTLNVARDNLDAQRLYERKGFRRVADEPGHWSYQDHLGRWIHVHEPAYRYEKQMQTHH